MQLIFLSIFYFITVFKCLFVCFTPTIYSLQKPQRSQRITGYQRILTTLYFIWFYDLWDQHLSQEFPILTVSEYGDFLEPHNN